MLNLAEIREYHSLSKTFVSNLVGLTTAQYTVYEDDKTGNLLKGNPDLLAKLAKLLGVDECDLFQREPKNDTASALARTYAREIDKDDFQKIKDLVAFRDAMDTHISAL